MAAVIASLAIDAAPAGTPGYGDPLTVTQGVVYHVGTVAALVQAVTDVNDANVPATILISNGTYVISEWALPITCDDVIVRSAGGNRDHVIIRGPDTGYSATVEHVFWVPASRVTIADITFGWCRYHGIQVHGQAPYNASGLWVHNCRIVNCNEQFIKGTSADSDPEGATDGLVENCLFEFTSGWAYQAYTGGIDVHKAVNWVVRDNLFRGIRNPESAGGPVEHAVHFWKRCTTRPQNVVVERNVVINCDRGIGFGLSSYDGGHDGGSSVIRNNMIYNSGDGPQTDVGIGLEYATDVLVDNNTVHVPYWAPIEYRFAGTQRVMFRNNLVNGAITARDGAPPATRSNNVQTAQATWYRNAAEGDLHLLPGTTAAVDSGCRIDSIDVDIDGHPRPDGGSWDVGADEYAPWRTDTDGDTIVDGWETLYGLDPGDKTDARDNDDGDACDNLAEYVADTHPRNGNDYLRVTAMDSKGCVRVWFEASSNRLYTLRRCVGLDTDTWEVVPGQERRQGKDGLASLVDSNMPANATCYDVGASLVP